MDVSRILCGELIPFSNVSFRRKGSEKQKRQVVGSSAQALPFSSGLRCGGFGALLRAALGLPYP